MSGLVDQLKLFVFDRELFLRAFMFACNLISQNYYKLVF